MTVAIFLTVGAILGVLMFFVGAICFAVGKTEGYAEGWDDSERLGAKYVRRSASSQEDKPWR